MIILLINEFVRNKFNEHKPQASILILENDNINIFEQENDSIILEQSNNLQFQLLDVFEIIETGEQWYLKIILPNGKIGYIRPLDSIIILPKQKKQVRISKNAKFLNSLNDYIGMDEEKFKNNRNKMMYSSHYAIYKNEIFECLRYIDEIVSFLKPIEVNKMERYEKSFTIYEDTAIYRDSMLTKPVKLLSKDKKSFKSQYIILKENKIRFKHNGKIYWLKISDTDLKIDLKIQEYENLNELILDTIIYQYLFKLENYHKYYQQILIKETTK